MRKGGEAIRQILRLRVGKVLRHLSLLQRNGIDMVQGHDRSPLAAEHDRRLRGRRRVPMLVYPLPPARRRW